MTKQEIISLIIERKESYEIHATKEAKFDKEFAKLMREKAYTLSLLLEEIKNIEKGE